MSFKIDCSLIVMFFTKLIIVVFTLCLLIVFSLFIMCFYYYHFFGEIKMCLHTDGRTDVRRHSPRCVYASRGKN